MVALVVGATDAQAAALRLLTWKGYAPNEVVEQFEKDTGVKVSITYSNNEEMISKLRATGGAGFDLAQPSQDRITGAQQDYKIYRAFDLKKVRTELFIASMLEATKKTTTLKGRVYGLPHIWGTDGLIVNKKAAGPASDYLDLCDTRYTGRVSYRAKRPALLGAGAVAFLMSFENFNTTLFLVGSDATLPITMFISLRDGSTPVINAVSLVLMVGSAGIGLVGIFSGFSAGEPERRPGRPRG